MEGWSINMDFTSINDSVDSVDECVKLMEGEVKRSLDLVAPVETFKREERKWAKYRKQQQWRIYHRERNKYNYKILGKKTKILLNFSLQQEVFVKEWKKSIVRPTLKKVGLELLLNNYRPVKKLEFCIKITGKSSLNTVNGALLHQ